MTDTKTKNSKYYLLLDVGGTQIKCALSDSNGTIINEPCYYPSFAKETKDLIFENLAFMINDTLSQVNTVSLLGIGMAFPGPFDYENGISLMKGLNKYDSIYGVSIEKEIKKLVPELNHVPFSFLHDVEAFAIGESWFGLAKDKKKLLCLCIGTGIGSAFIHNHEAQKKEENGVPFMGWLYNSPFKESILDDYISVRGLLKISIETYGEELTGKELSELCKKKDSKALETYFKFGQDLFTGLLPFIQNFSPDAVVFGGQISKSFCYFGQLLTQYCEKEKINIYLEEDTSVLSMKGLLMEMKRKEEVSC